MAQGILGLRRIQYGFETTSGTAVPATHVLRMTGTPQDTRDTIMPDEHVGILPGLDRSYTPKTGGEFAVEGEATFEQLPVILNCAICEEVNTTDAGGYVHTFAFATDTAKTIRTLTMEGGDNAGCESMDFCYVPEFTLSGNAGEAWMLTATFRGGEVTTDTFTPSSDVTTPAVEEILFSKTSLYIASATTDALGTTDQLVSNTMLAASIRFETGWAGVDAADGGLDFSFVKQVAPEIVADLTFEHNTSSIAEKAAWRANTTRRIRLYTPGSDGSRDLYIDLAGRWETFDAIGEQDGNDIVRGTFRARYNTTAALFCTVAVHNNNAVSS